MNIPSFLLYCFIITFTPGPTNIVILATTQRHGLKIGLRYAYGSSVAFFILLALSASLNTALATLLPKILVWLQVVGTLYMLYLAYKIYHMAISFGGESTTGGFMAGFIMQFANPKVVLFTLTVLPSFVLPYDDRWFTVALSVGAITVIGLGAFMMWAFFGVVLTDFLQKHARIGNAVMALGLVYAAVMVWM